MGIIQKIFGTDKWKLKRRKVPRPSMARGLQWLSDHEIYVETVIDVGASYGIWSKRCMNFFPKAKYVLFEPQPVHHEALDAFAASCEQTVIPVKKAVGASEGQSHFLFDPDDPFSGVVTRDESENTIKVDLTTIDSSLSKLQVGGPFLLKLDTHGFERSILKGAAQTLDNTNILIIEAYNYRITDEVFLFWELCAYLYDKGFSPIDLVDVGYRKYDGSLWQMDLFFLRSTWEGFQYVSYK